MNDRYTLGRLALSLAAILYALFSSPSPDSPGLIECVIIVLLLAAGLCGGLCFKDDWARPLLALLLYGASVPLLIGVFSSAMPGDLLRDTVAFAALGLPLLLAGLFTGHGRILLGILIGIGLVFALRYLMMPDMVLASLAAGPFDDRLLYLANSPLVFFAALWLLLRGSFVESRIHYAVFLIVLSLIPIAAMIGMMQRATLALLALAWLAGLIIVFIRKPRRGFVMAGIATVLLAISMPFLGVVAQGLLLKTEMVGWNARAQEWSAVLDQIGQGPLSVLFGTGWGSLMQSPAVGDQWVRFSHSLVSSMLWKTGWVGLILTLIAIGSLVLACLRRWRTDIVTTASLILAMIPACFLYGSYKSLCFGLLLTGLAVLAIGQNPALDANQSGDHEVQ